MTVINEIATIEFNGKRWLRWEGLLLVPLDFDPNSGVIVAVAPPGGIAGAGGVANLPALVKGDNGLSPVLQEDSEVTEIEWNDPTPATSQWVLVTPGTDTIAPVYKEVKTLRKGQPGAEVLITVAGASDIAGTPNAGDIIFRNEDNDGFIYRPPILGDMFWPATINALSGTTSGELCRVLVPAQNFDWRPIVSGGCLVDGDGPGDVVVDIVAHLNTSTGNIVGRAYGRPGTAPPQHGMISGPPQGAAADHNRILAGYSAIIIFRAERQLGSDTFSVNNATARFSVVVLPIP